VKPSIWIRPLPGGLGISAELERLQYHFEYVPRERLDEAIRNAERLGSTLAEVRAEKDAKRVFVSERWDIRWPDGGALENRSLREARERMHGGGRIVHVKVYRVKKGQKP
jgi:hypothetical protein